MRRRIWTSSFKRRKKTKKKEYDEKVERGNEKKKRLD